MPFEIEGGGANDSLAALISSHTSIESLISMSQEPARPARSLRRPSTHFTPTTSRNGSRQEFGAVAHDRQQEALRYYADPRLTAPKTRNGRSAPSGSTSAAAPAAGGGPPPVKDRRDRMAAKRRSVMPPVMRETKAIRDVLPQGSSNAPEFVRDVRRVLARVQRDWPAFASSAPGAELSGGNISSASAKAEFARIDTELEPDMFDDSLLPSLAHADIELMELVLSFVDPNVAAQLPYEHSEAAFQALRQDLDDIVSLALQDSKSKKPAYLAYDASLMGYREMLSSISSSKAQALQVRNALAQVREQLQGRDRKILGGLHSRLSDLDEMDKNLESIDKLRRVPDKLESLLAEKHLHHAAALLVKAIKLLDKAELLEIPSVAELRSWLKIQQSALLEIIIEELSSHLYLKSVLSKSRWRAYDPDAQASSTSILDAGSPDDASLQTFLAHISSHPPPNDNEQDLEDLLVKTSSSHADSFSCIESLIEALATLGKVRDGLDTIFQRVPQEIQLLVDNTIDDVAARHAKSLSAPVQASALTETTLNDLFYTLFSKLSATLEGFRVAHEVLLRIVERRHIESLKEGSTLLLFSLIDVWKPIQTEVRMLLQDYLTDDSANSMSALDNGMRLLSVNDVLAQVNTGSKISPFELPPGQAQPFLFAFSDASQNEAAVSDDLMRHVKAALPGSMLNVADTNSSSSNQPTSLAALTGAVDRAKDPSSSAPPQLTTVRKQDVILSNHRRIVPGDAFNLSILFVPTMAFLEKLNYIMPSGLIADDDSFGSFLEKFVTDTYLPQLELKANFIINTSLDSSSAFDPHPSALLSESASSSSSANAVPISNIAFDLVQLVRSLCSMLNSTDSHSDRYAQLIVAVAQKFHDAATEYFSSLTAPSNPSADTLLALRWSHRPQFAAIMSDILKSLDASSPSSPSNLAELYKREIHHQTAAKSTVSLSYADLLAPPSSLRALGLLYSSLVWFASEISPLARKSSNSSNSPLLDPNASLAGSSRPSLSRKASFASAKSLTLMSSSDRSMVPSSFEDPITSAELTPTSKSALAEILAGLDGLARTILFSIRTDTRIRAMFFLDRATRASTYQLTEPVSEPATPVLDLNAELLTIDTALAATFRPRERSFVFAGFNVLFDHLLVINARNISTATPFAYSKMHRNILAIQQALRALGPRPLEALLPRARQYWDAFHSGPYNFIHNVKTRLLYAFDFEELRVLLSLMCNVDNSSDSLPAQEASAKSRRLYNELLIELHNLAKDVA